MGRSLGPRVGSTDDGSIPVGIGLQGLARLARFIGVAVIPSVVIVGGTAALGAPPTPLVPSNGSTVHSPVGDPLAVRLDVAPGVNPPSGADQFAFWIARNAVTDGDGDPQTNPEFLRNTEPAPQSEWTTPPLDPDGVYQWKSMQCVFFFGGCTTFSDTWSFTMTAPPKLLSPASGAKVFAASGSVADATVPVTLQVKQRMYNDGGLFAYFAGRNTDGDNNPRTNWDVAHHYWTFPAGTQIAAKDVTLPSGTQQWTSQQCITYQPVSTGCSADYTRPGTFHVLGAPKGFLPEARANSADPNNPVVPKQPTLQATNLAWPQRFEVSTSATFPTSGSADAGTGVAAHDAAKTRLSWKAGVPTALVAGKTYTWTVRSCFTDASAAAGTDCSGWAHQGKFTVDVAPATPQLPANGATLPTGVLTPTLQAGASGDAATSPNPVTYQFVVADNPEFTGTPIAESPVGSALTWTLPAGKLAAGQTVYWGVRTCVVGSCGQPGSASRLTAQGAAVVATMGATVRISQTAGGSGGGGTSPTVSRNGRWATFISSSQGLVADDTNGVADAFLADRQNGTLERVSLGSGRAQINGATTWASISDDGRFVTYLSTATNAVTGDTNALADVFVHDRQTGATERVSVSDSEAQATGGAASSKVDISADGNLVVFVSAATNLVTGDTNTMPDVFLRNRSAGTTQRISVSSAGAQQTAAGTTAVESPQITPDGRYIVYVSTGAGLVTGDTNARRDVFVRDRTANTTVRASVKTGGGQAAVGTDGAAQPNISANGTWVTFHSDSTDLVPSDTNAQNDVFLRNMSAGTTERVSVGASAAQGNQAALRGAVSDDGRYVTFASSSTNLVTADSNSRWDIFRRDRTAGVTTRVSMSSDDVQGTVTAANSYTFADVSADGRFVAYESVLNGLQAGDTDSAADIFLTDMAIARTRALPITPAPQSLGTCDNNLGAAEASGCDDDDDVREAIGNYTTSETDLSLPGVGIPFALTRTYNSADTRVGALGPGWSHSLRASLTEHPNLDITVTGEDGQGATFYSVGGGSYVAEPGITSALSKDASGNFVLTTLEGDKQTFSGQGKLLSSRDEHNEGLTVSYDAQGRVSTVIDSAGRTVTVTYLASAEMTRIERVTLPDGRYVQYGYSAAPEGRLTSVRDARGKVTTYEYDGSGKLWKEIDPRGNAAATITYTGSRVATITDAEGGVTTIAWNAATGVSTRTDQRGKVWTRQYSNNTLLSESTPLGHTTAYGYDARLNRVLVRDARGKETRFSFDDRGNQLEEMGPAPFTFPETWRYDARNKLTSQTDRRGYSTTHLYSPTTGDLLETTDPRGGKTTYTYDSRGLVRTEKDERGQLTGKVTTYDYDTAGNRTSVTTPMGLVTRFAYDSSGRKISETDPRGELTPGDSNDFKTSFTYDENDDELTETDARGATTTTTYDDNGNAASVTDRLGKVTTYTYDRNNRPRTVVEPRTAGVTATTTTTYDAAGNVLSVTRPNGQKTTFTYDDTGRRATMVTPRGNAVGATASAYTWTYGHDQVGNTTSVTAPATAQPLAAATTTTVYDALNRVISVTNGLNKTTRTSYDAEANVIATSNPLGQTTTAEYDELGRRIAETTPRGKRATFAFDESGNLREAVSPTGAKTTFGYDDDHRQISRVDPRGNVAGATPTDFDWLYGYDASGNQRTVADPLGNTTTTDYDANDNAVSVTDANAHQTSYTFDAEDQLVGVVGADAPSCTTGAQCLNGKAATRYEYDDAGNLVKRTDPLGRVTTSKYDLSERLTETLSPIGKKWTFEYDLEDNQTKEITAKGNASATPATGSINRAFDPRSQLTGITYGDGLTSSVSVSYDNAGRTTQMQNGSGAETYSYDDADRLTTVARGAETFTYTYNADGQVESRKYPDNTTHGATFDDDGRVASITSAGATTTFGYDKAGNLTSETLPSANGHVATRTFDAAGRLTRVESKKGTAVTFAQGRVLDAVGNPIRQSTTRGTTVMDEAYQYDAADRLTKNCLNVTACPATPSAYAAWTYDAVGNRLTQTRLGMPANNTSTTYSYNDADQLTQTVVAGGATTTYTYDDNGNQVTEGQKTFAYDLENRLRSHVAGGVTTTYAYDGFGKRLSKTVGGTSTTSRWDTVGPLPEIALEQTGSGTLVRRYVQGPAGPLAVQTGAGSFWYHLDGLGSVRGVTNSAGAEQWRHDYEPFGEPRSTVQVAPSAPANPALFVGEYHDSESGLYHLRARQYDPLTGRFGALDPESAPLLEPAFGEYVYAGSSPLLFLDPDGRKLLPSGGCSCTPRRTTKPQRPAAPRWGAKWRAVAWGVRWGKTSRPNRSKAPRQPKWVSNVANAASAAAAGLQRAGRQVAAKEAKKAKAAQQRRRRSLGNRENKRLIDEINKANQRAWRAKTAANFGKSTLGPAGSIYSIADAINRTRNGEDPWRVWGETIGGEIGGGAGAVAGGALCSPLGPWAAGACAVGGGYTGSFAGQKAGGMATSPASRDTWKLTIGGPALGPLSYLR